MKFNKIIKTGGAIIVIAIVFCAGVVVSYKMLQQRNNRIRFQTPPVAIQLDSTNLPIVIINTQGKAHKITKERYLKANVSIVNNNSHLNYLDTITHEGQMIEYMGLVNMRLRGQSSLGLDKKSFALRLITETGAERKTKVMGMEKSDKWSLLAMRKDGSLMRDALTYDLAWNYFGYVPRTKYCEVVIDGIYQGVYLLAEEVSRDRVNVKKAATDDDRLFTGYLLDKSRNADFYSKYPLRDGYGHNVGNKGVGIEVKYPKKGKITKKQLQHIGNDVSNMEDAIESGRFEEFEKFVDVESFANYQLLQEFTGNVDAYRYSIKLYKSKGEDVFQFAPWDFDMTYGNCIRFGETSANEWNYCGKYEYVDASENVVFWWQKMMQNPQYANIVKCQWEKMRSESFTTRAIDHKIDSLYTYLTSSNASERDAKAWQTYSPYRKGQQSFVLWRSFSDEVDYLRMWIHSRIAYMDSELLNKDLDFKSIDSLNMGIGRNMLWE